MTEVNNILHDGLSYIVGACHSIYYVIVLTLTGLNYLLFPNNTLKTSAIGLGGAIVLDILTKYYAISINNGGLINAINTKKINSDSLWNGTKRKLVDYGIIMVLAGLSIRVIVLIDVAVFFATIAYSVMFLRESQSVIENLVDAGHSDLEWLIIWLKGKQEDVLKATPTTSSAVELDTQLNNTNGTENNMNENNVGGGESIEDYEKRV